MSSSLKALAGAAALVAALAAVAQPDARFPGIGRAATPKEVAAWDIDVRPDFKGLPPGSGSVARGGDIWEAKCSACHGSFGESNSTFSPLVGGTTAEDVRTGRVARLLDPAYPGRTTMMKVATVSTLWDYIHRAMPWTAPKSLKPDEVYAVLAYLLNLANVVPENFTLSDRNIADVQKLMPNRNGMRLDHDLWPGRGLATASQPDAAATACMKDCATEPAVASFLPPFARNAHGNLALQNRGVGAQLGADTARPPPQTLEEARTIAAEVQALPPGTTASTLDALALLRRNNCTACHAVDNKIVGPALREVAKKYRARADAADYLARKIRSGGNGVWGEVTMPAQTLPAEEARELAQWIAGGAGQ